jgi:PhoH-like ATPase
MTKKTKCFVLDTNVILHDFQCIYNFQDNDVYLPIYVLEEIDKFKHGNEQINFNAREFTRELDRLSNELLFTEGVPLGSGKGRLFVVTAQRFSKELEEIFYEKTKDHHIIAIAAYVAKENAGRKTIFVSKDINLRMKSKSIGITAEDYTTDKIESPDLLSNTIKTYANCEADFISRLYSEHEGIPKEELEAMPMDFKDNDCYILKNHNSSVLSRYSAMRSTLRKVIKSRISGIEPRNAEQAFALDILLDPTVSLVALTGKAGTGKTLLALAAALQQSGVYSQILLARPIVALANKDLGVLPGDEKQKISPYMQPLFDNLSVIKHQYAPTSPEVSKINEMVAQEQIQITPLAYIRGRSLSDTFFIIDEAQNLTPHEVKTIVTRAGEGTKMIFTGDVFQIDSLYLDEHSNGLANLIDKMKGQDIFGHVNLLKGERSYLSELASQLL